MSLIFHLPKYDGGFFCQTWKIASNYLYAKKNNFDYCIIDTAGRLHTKVNLMKRSLDQTSPLIRLITVTEAKWKLS